MTTATRAAEIFHALSILLAPGAVAELRLPETHRGVYSGYFDDVETMASRAADWSGNCPAVYFTLNPVRPELLCRSRNRLKNRPKETTTNAEIVSRRWLPLDIDPIRPAGISATDAEHDAALAKAQQCKAWLTEKGWPPPLAGDSGNGANLLYRIELPNDELSTLLVEGTLRALSQRFTDAQIEIDTAVGNAARIWKVYGTIAGKGDNAADLGRPHRVSKLLEIPAEISVVSREQLAAIAALATESAPKKNQQGKNHGSFDVRGWLAKHGIAVESDGPWQGGHKYVLEKCPLDPAHTRTAYVVQLAGGALSAGCLHDSCAELSWQKLREMHEPRPDAPPFSDDALALTFTETHGDDLKYTASMGCWHHFVGTHWQQDESLLTFTHARNICRAVAKTVGEPERARRLASSTTVASVERLARFDERHAATTELWDADPWLLNCPAGTIDLRTGEMREHRRGDFITKITAVSPGGDCPQWLKFLGRITNENPELQRFMQRMCGYALTGITRAHALFFLYGTGANGKSTFVNTIADLLGPYHTAAPAEMLMVAHFERHPCDMAGLRGKRLVTATEVEKGGRWAEAKLKALTGGDRITARFMHQNFFEYTPQFKLVVVGNHRPALRSVDEAIRRRMNLVPFTVTIPEAERDPELGEKLKAESPGILRWAIDGCLAWQHGGLNPPAVVRDATTDYFSEEDALARWIEQRCILGSQCEATSTALFVSWREWAESAGEYVGSQKNFGQTLETREGITRCRTGRLRGYRGIRLRTSADDAAVAISTPTPDEVAEDAAAEVEYI
jgi:P4 family phage/plasmid primase-like protien